MEWLNQSTDGWKLKKSFALYLFLSFIIGITFSKVFSLILTELQNQIFNSSIKEIQLNGEFVYYYIKDKSMLVEVL
ncbi:hypothetical protein GOQ29_11880 [Clostridium sp. D2Q-14]|uniref:hypothetical protein n=1 Tax=Anaeromonas gelatinilytica TaxID=2683194 RepID=UPI00193AEF95|nr:hypothetical protein [Anaeromonas gelatinilytica]MBS4536316.1 hypothetical protein [Anaeromonas gelatinilytica]